MSTNKQANSEKYPIGEEYTLFDKMVYIVDLLNSVLIQQQNKQLCSAFSRSYKKTLKPARTIKNLIAEFESAYPDLIDSIDSHRHLNLPQCNELLRDIFYLCQTINIKKYSKKLAKSNLLILAKGVLASRDGIESTKQTDLALSYLYSLQPLLRRYTTDGDGIIEVALNKLKSGNSRWFVSRYDIGINLITRKLAAEFIKNPAIFHHSDIAASLTRLHAFLCMENPSNALLENISFGAKRNKRTSELLKIICSVTSIDSEIEEQSKRALAISNTEIDRVFFHSPFNTINKEQIIARVNSIQDHQLIDSTTAYDSLGKSLFDRQAAFQENRHRKKPLLLAGDKKLISSLVSIKNVIEIESGINNLSTTIHAASSKAPLGFNSLLEVAGGFINEESFLVKLGVSKDSLNNLKSVSEEAVQKITTSQVEFITSARQSVFENVTQLVLGGDLANGDKSEDAIFAKELVDSNGDGVFVEIHSTLPKDKSFRFSHSTDDIIDVTDEFDLADELPGETAFPEEEDLGHSSQEEAIDTNTTDSQAVIDDTALNSGTDSAKIQNIQAELDAAIEMQNKLRIIGELAAEEIANSKQLLEISQNKSSELALQLVTVENENTVLTQHKAKLENTVSDLTSKVSDAQDEISNLSQENTAILAKLQNRENQQDDNSLLGQLNQLISLYNGFSTPISDSLLNLDLSIGELIHSNPENMIDPAIQDKLHDLFDVRQKAAKSNPKFISELQASSMSKKSNSGLKATDFDPSLSYSLDGSTLLMILDKKSSLEAGGKTPTVSDIRTTLNMLSTTLNNLKNYEDFERFGKVTDQARDLVSFQAKTGIMAVRDMSITLAKDTPESIDMVVRVLRTFLDRYEDKDLSIGNDTLEGLVLSIESSIRNSLDGANVVALNGATKTQ